MMGPSDSMFVRNISAFTDALGVENAPTVMWLSLAPWQSDNQRNTFIEQLTGISMREVNDIEAS